MLDKSYDTLKSNLWFYIPFNGQGHTGTDFNKNFRNKLNHFTNNKCMYNVQNYQKATS